MRLHRLATALLAAALFPACHPAAFGVTGEQMALSSAMTPAANPLLDVPKRSALAASGSFVQRRGTTLFDGAHVFRALGGNRFDLAAGPKSLTCKRDRDAERLYNRQLATLQTLREAGGTVMRLWAFQAMAGPMGDDFTYLDNLIAAAHEVGVNLILVLENHYGECSAIDTAERDVDWYRDGYRRPYGGYALSFPDYVDRVVGRYHDETAIVMWQIVNEAQAPGHPDVVRSFLEEMTATIRKHDKTHLVCGGGSMDCGSPDGEREYEVMAQVPGMDVLDVHDFGADRSPWPACLATAKSVADRNQLTLMIGESGIAQDPEVPTHRAYLMRRKISAAAAQGVGIYLLWSMNTDPQYPDRFDVLRGDPVLQVMQEQAMDAFGMSRNDGPWWSDEDDEPGFDWTQVELPAALTLGG